MNLTWIYVGALYAAAVHIARRLGAALPGRIAALFYLLVLLFFFRPMTQHYVNVPVDFLGILSPWGQIQYIHPSNREANDVALQMVPWAHVVREQWKSLRFPLWNPYSGSGSILLANGQSAALSPLRLLTLPLPLGNAFTAEAAMKLLIGTSFMFLFCRRRYSEIASATGAIAYGFCTFLICWLHFPHATVAAYVPAALFIVELLAERITARRVAFGAMLWAAILLGGHPETASHIFFLTALIVLWILAVERPFARRASARLIGALALMMFLATLIASPFLVSFAEAVRKSQRYQQLKVHSNPVIFTQFPYAVALLQPHFFGPLDQDKWGPAGAETASGFAGILGIAGWIAMLIETMRTKRWRTREAFFVLTVPLLVGIMFNWPLIGVAFHKLFALAANARVRLLLCFVMSVQTAAAIDLSQRGRRLPLLIGIGVTSGMLSTLVLTSAFPTAWAHDNTILAMLPSLIVLAVAVWLAVAGRSRRLAEMAAVVAVIVEMFAAGIYWNAVLPDRLMYPMTPLLRRLVAVVHKADLPYRIVGTGAMLFPNTSAMYGLQDIRAHDPMSNGRYLGLLRALTGFKTDEYFAHWRNTETKMLDYLNVRWLLAEPGTPELNGERYRKVYEGKDGTLYENLTVLPRFFAVRNVVLAFRRDSFIRQIVGHSSWRDTAVVDLLPVENDQMRQDFLRALPASAPEASVHITKAGETDFSMRVHAPRYSLVVSSQPFWPGWRVRMNGTRILTRPVNGAFLGFTVPPGDWDVRVDYFPLPFYIAFAVSMLTMAGLVVVCMFHGRSPRLRGERARTADEGTRI